MALNSQIARADTYRRDKEDTGHDMGWPHYNSRGNCMCFCKRCFSDRGCICKGCAGVGHANCHRASEAA